MPAGLRVRLLGGFQVEVADRRVPDGEWQRGGATAVVKILALRGRLHRDQIADLLWPEAEAMLGRRRLDKALHFARRVLGTDRLLLREGMLSLAPAGLWVDVDAFESAARRGDTEAALALYTGDLLPENRFDDWTEPRRAQLREAVVPLLLERSAHHEPTEAESDLVRLIALDPLHEEAYARLMRLESARGHRHRALRWYDRLAARLREDLGVEPRDDLQRLHRELTTTPAPVGAVPATAAAGTVPSGPVPAGPAPGGATAGLRDAVAEERKLVTVLDADLRGVRGDALDDDPERARREITRWTGLLREIVERWGGAVEPLVGGGVIGVFGYPTAREDHADRALRAGSEILRRSPAPIRLGADTGQIIATAELSQIAGAVLDTAARLRAAAAPRTLLVSDRTRRAARGPEFCFSRSPDAGPSLDTGRLPDAGRSPDAGASHDAGDSHNAGHSHDAGDSHNVGHLHDAGDSHEAGRSPDVGEPPVGAWRLLSAGPAGAADSRTPDEAPMTGRVGEMSAVLALIEEAVTTRRPRLITITGVAGIGKTRLVREVVARQPGMRVLHGRCLAAGDGITFWALGEILRAACGIPLGDADARAPQRLRARLRQIFDGQRLTPAELDATIFALATTAAIRLPDNPLDQADPRDVADELGRAWPRLASAFAARGPLLLVVEDLHWAGAPLVGMVSRLVTRSTGPVVLLTTARPEFLESRPDLPDVSMVSLRSLPAGDSGALLDSLPHAAGLDQRQRSRILTRAEGNPYFLGQLAAHLAEHADGGLPDTLHALLAARVDALPAPEKRLLQVAAVMGRVFWTAPLRERLGPELPGLLGALENRGLVRARPGTLVTGQHEYAFQHALLRDVAYASLPVAERAAGHAEVAAWLEEVSRERIDEVIELVAVHYAAAADGPDADDWTRGKAFRSLITAGVGARRRYAVPRALDLHHAARRHASNPAERAGALEAVGDDHETAYDGDKAVRAWRDAITALRDTPEHADRRARLCLKTAQMLVARWGGFRVPADPSLGDRVIDEGLAAVTDPPTRAQLLSLRALCGARWAWTGRTDPVPVSGRRRAATDAAVLADRLGSPTLRGQALLGHAAVYFLEGRYDDAVTAVLDEVALVEQEGSHRDRALGHTIASLTIGAVHGDYRLALEHAHRSYEWARDLSPHDRLHGTAAVLICLEQLGRDHEIDPFLDEHLRLRQGPMAAMSCPYIRSGPLVGALALARRGDRHESEKVAATVEPDLDQPGNAEVLRARLALHRGDVTTGRDLAERLVAMGRRPGPEEIPHEALVLLRALEAAGDHAALRRFLPRARAAAGYLAQLTPACDHAEAITDG